jgi:hypothetical protein
MTIWATTWGSAGHQVEDLEVVHLERVEQCEELARSVDAATRGHDAEPGALAEQVGPVGVPADVLGQRGEHGGQVAAAECGVQVADDGDVIGRGGGRGHDVLPWRAGGDRRP